MVAYECAQISKTLGQMQPSVTADSSLRAQGASRHPIPLRLRDREGLIAAAQIESKIFFCDAKANTRGLYLKISEKGTNRERSTIIVPGQSLPWFRELFNYYASTEPS